LHSAVTEASTKCGVRRAGAYLFDQLITIWLPVTLFGALVFSGGVDDEGVTAVQGFAFLVSPISFVYFVVMEAGSGATLGKRLLGIRVVGADGAKVSWGASLVRNLMRLVDLMFWAIPALISMVMSPLDQRLGDRVAKTVVVRARG